MLSTHRLNVRPLSLSLHPCASLDAQPPARAGRPTLAQMVSILTTDTCQKATTLMGFITAKRAHIVLTRVIFSSFWLMRTGVRKIAPLLASEEQSPAHDAEAPALPRGHGGNFEGPASYFHERLVGGEREADGADQELQPRSGKPGEQPDANCEPDNDAGRQEEHVAQVPLSPGNRALPPGSTSN